MNERLEEYKNIIVQIFCNIKLFLNFDNSKNYKFKIKKMSKFIIKNWKRNIKIKQKKNNYLLI